MLSAGRQPATLNAWQLQPTEHLMASRRQRPSASSEPLWTHPSALPAGPRPSHRCHLAGRFQISRVGGILEGRGGEGRTEAQLHAENREVNLVSLKPESAPRTENISRCCRKHFVIRPSTSVTWQPLTLLKHHNIHQGTRLLGTV